MNFNTGIKKNYVALMEKFKKFVCHCNMWLEKINAQLILFKNNIKRIVMKRRFLFVLSLIFTIPIIYFTGLINLKQYPYFEGLRVEAGGFVLDIILFGLVLGYYNYKTEKKQKIENYKNEIDDYREWDEKEASYRIYGLMKRLVKLNELKVDISSCYFENIKFFKMHNDTFNFYEFVLTGAVFKDCKLNSCNFSNIKMSKKGTDCKDYICEQMEPIKFINCDLSLSIFKNHDYYVIEFDNSITKYADFTNSTFEKCIFKGIDFSEVILNNTHFKKECTFIECIGEERLTIDEIN